MTDPFPRVYRKRKASGVIVRAVVIILAALVILAVMLFFGLRKYIAYTDTGRLYLDIPWLAGYMDGRPEDDPLSSELTLTADSYKSDLPAEEKSGKEEPSPPGASGEKTIPASDGTGQEETVLPGPDGSVPEG